MAMDFGLTGQNIALIYLFLGEEARSVCTGTDLALDDLNTAFAADPLPSTKVIDKDIRPLGSLCKGGALHNLDGCFIGEKCDPICIHECPPELHRIADLNSEMIWRKIVP